MNHLLLKRSRIALNEVYDVVCEGRSRTNYAHQCAGALLVVDLSV